MRENCTYGSEGGEGVSPSLPLSDGCKPRVSLSQFGDQLSGFPPFAQLRPRMTPK